MQQRRGKKRAQVYRCLNRHNLQPASFRNPDEWGPLVRCECNWLRICYSGTAHGRVLGREATTVLIEDLEEPCFRQHDFLGWSKSCSREVWTPHRQGGAQWTLPAPPQWYALHPVHVMTNGTTGIAVRIRVERRVPRRRTVLAKHRFIDRHDPTDVNGCRTRLKTEIVPDRFSVRTSQADQAATQIERLRHIQNRGSLRDESQYPRTGHLDFPGSQGIATVDVHTRPRRFCLASSTDRKSCAGLDERQQQDRPDRIRNWRLGLS